jgi:hypothetical protein
MQICANLCKVQCAGAKTRKNLQKLANRTGDNMMGGQGRGDYWKILT